MARGRLGAIFGDVLIVLGVVGLAQFVVGAGPLVDLNPRGWIALTAIGFVVSIMLEWAARALGLWGYTSWMPTLTVWKHTVGLSPIAQVTLLPALSVSLASWSEQLDNFVKIKRTVKLYSMV